MKIGARITLVLLLAGAVGMAGSLGVAGYFLLEGHRDAEAEALRADAEQASSIVRSDLAELEGTARELGQITLLVFAGGESNSDENATADLADVLFTANDLDLLFFYGPFNETGQPGEPRLFGMRYDGPGTQLGFNTTSASLNASVIESGILADAQPFESRSAVVGGPGEAVLLAAHAMPLDLFGSAEPVVIAVGRDLDDEYAASVGDRAGLEVQLEVGSGFMPLGGDGFAIHRSSTDAATGTLAWSTADGAPLQVIIHDDRALFAKGLQSVAIFSAAAFLLTAVVTIVALWAIRRTVTERIRGLARGMAAIAQADNLSGRVAIEGSDEIAAMAGEFDHLMGLLEVRSQALQERNVDLERFAAVVSHDLLSPLSTVSLNLKILEESVPADDAKGRICMDRMRRTADRMASRVRGVLAYSRAAQTALPLVPVDAGVVLQRVLDDSEASIRESGAKIEVGDLPVVIADEERLAQVFQNLVANAIKYTREGRDPIIQIFGIEGAEPSIVVEDNGRGFQQEDAALMLEPFTRLANAGDRDGEGMGLATCARIMAASGGRLEAQGKPGVGARFTLWFPRTD